MIVGVAIWDDVITVKLPKPNRHCHCFWHLSEKLGLDPNSHKIGRPALNQGFYTHTGKVLNREQAVRYVKRIKQPTIDGPVKRALFSEDLW